MAAAEEDNVDATTEETLASGQPKKHEHQQAAHLDKVTDYVEEQEIRGDVGKVTYKIGLAVLSLRRLSL